ncbi:phosphatase PAP2 family protein [Aerococcus kribbianus]|uniref:Phosphatase PAP2 family protein n=1 Tax=Aerococcus kribbianus TaxID=2999064 RepID=A0A9X3JGL6_9LACT|nr:MULTISPECIES: phosphatase PAP2 family protein [unclassified Aerococcus]MCZ0717411.1 phosphatase PAP2 family protein [Aerococcus sp. YH-aer221]MCZ0725699.1 phosphatase PAP2 family protein [Aerococcus sp. YH-aer222]
MSNYQEFYRRISRPFRHSQRACAVLRTLNQTITRLMYVSYPFFLILSAWQKGINWTWFLYVLVPAGGLLLVSLLRWLIARPRPYEIEGIEALISRKGKRDSMPSKHVFSSALISLTIFSLYPIWGMVYLVLTVLLAKCRVVSGVHYPSDVLVSLILAYFMTLLY